MSMPPPGSTPGPDDQGWATPPSFPPPGGATPPGGTMPPGGATPPGWGAPGDATPPGATPPGAMPPGMPPPGATPPGGFAPPPAYAPPPAGYGAPMGAPMGGYAGAAGPVAEWPQRALGALIDYVAPAIVYVIASRILWVFAILVWLAWMGWAFYNAYLTGQTGQSIGKKIAGVKIVSEQTGLPIGGGMGIARYFAHILDGLACGVGWLWPLWDAKKQTFADKVIKTVAVTVPK